MRLSRYGEGEPSGPDTARLGRGERAAWIAGLDGVRTDRLWCVSLSDHCGLPRKEVIQPHLPVRLPCYDFTPLTLHTFGASPPLGLGRRLRVQTTRVV